MVKTKETATYRLRRLVVVVVVVNSAEAVIEEALGLNPVKM